MCSSKTIACYGMLLSTCLLATECRRNDYDMSKGVNLEITVGGDSLTIPLGSLKPVTLGAIIDEQSVDILKKSENCWQTKGASGRVRVKLFGLTFPVTYRICGRERFIAQTDIRLMLKSPTRSTASRSVPKSRRL